ncbi:MULTISPECIES: hypothetical protein [unclassified Polaribacter]|uniref:hypothetical protein n=1 Tax=unclassified Polaribacter TaxID=196858 RepID=UPI0011BF7239|nr:MULTISPECIES: hypothetical protein [unclassified Polaribacter]TXD48503.1 hypothetical protein ES043_17745 [Polaribacter sp. IC063]TXD55836.1 hypothetical protein ES044_17705 [Polaribacter sp. IC066]
MKKLFIATVMSLFFYGSIYSQETIEETEEETIEEVSEMSIKRKNAIGFSLGTGLGIDYSRVWKPNKLYVTAGFNALVFSINNIEQEISGENLLVDTELDFKNFEMKISYHPFSNAFKLVGGVGFFASSNTNVKTTFKDNIVFGEVEFNTDDSGSLDIDVNWFSVAPYLGLGFGRAVPNKRWGFAADLGTYFSSSPNITLDATGIIEQSKNQEALLNESFESFKFIPYATLRVSYSF